MAAQEWQSLTKLTAGADFIVERIRLVESAVAVEGQFALPPLARLTAEDQVFVIAFVRCHGSIKQMEKFFGVSYPTIKNRLNRIGALLPFAEMTPGDPAPSGPSPTSELLSRLERGEINVNDVLSRLKKAEDDDE
jgi:hypothetical protein